MPNKLGNYKLKTKTQKKTANSKWRIAKEKRQRQAQTKVHSPQSIVHRLKLQLLVNSYELTTKKGKK